MAPRRRGQAVHGWVLVDKPTGVTSTRVVGRVRRVYDARKAGHGGTLDPLASGLLPIALGEATKTVGYVMDGRKSYRFTTRWGVETTTDDSEGEVVSRHSARPGDDEIIAILGRFTGTIQQVPPQFSAIKVGGRRAYDLARARQDVHLEARAIRIERLDLVARPDPDHATFEVACGKGAYMRALARDLGRALGTAAHVVSLRRTAVGGFRVEHAISLETLETLGHSAAALEHLLPVEAALDGIPALVLSETEASRLRHGRPVSFLARSDRERSRTLTQGDVAYAVSAGKPVALVQYDAGDLRPLRVLNL